MVIVFLLAGLAAVAALVGLHWYVWRRLVRDTTAGPGRARRVGTVVFVALPVMMVGALVAERGGAPFWLQRTLAWPGFLWLALFIYLGLALIAGEAVRPLLRRFLERRRPAGASVPPAPLRKTETVPAGASETPEPAPGTPDAPSDPSAPDTPASPASSPLPPDASSSPVWSPARRPPWRPGRSDTARTASCAAPA